MTENDRHLDPDDVLALHLAAGKTVRRAASKAGISESTAYRKLREQGFKDRVSQLRQDMVDQALGRLSDGMTSAAVTLRRLLRAKSETVKLGAARALLELTTKLKETVELADRISKLEQQGQQQ